MNCYWCNAELIIGGDIDIEDGMNGYPEFSIMTNLSCPKCHSEVEVLKKEMLLIDGISIFKEIS
ncbi:hypothetical protein [uncultured phage MedDCM-OCT-S01-C104]|nr:hypothetical protein [uncultured phage MedDCM-OCT-S01-C104]